MLSLALARRLGSHEGGRRAATRLKATAAARSTFVASQRATCAPTGLRSISSLPRTPQAGPPRESKVATPRRSLKTASVGESGGWRGGSSSGSCVGAGFGGGNSQGSRGRRNRRHLSGGLRSEGGGSREENVAAAATAEAAETPQRPKKRRPMRPRKVPHPFGEPLSSFAASASADDGDDVPSWAVRGGGGGGDVEDELPDPELIEVEREGGFERGAEMDANDPRARVTAPRPEVIHALSRGLTEGSAREVADNLCSYASTDRTTESTLSQLSRALGRRPHQAEWVMPLVSAHLKDEQKPSAETHQEHLSYVRDVNTKEASLEDMAEILLRGYARHRWGPDMTREKLRTDHPERWEEAMSLSAKLADRLPACRYQLVWKTLEKFMGAERNRRRHRVLGELSTVVRGSAHLVLPAIAKFWRTELSSQGLEEVVVDTKTQHLETQIALARWLLFARRKNLPTVEEFAGPWSIEELQELDEARVREQARETENLREEYPEDEESDGGGEAGGRSGRRESKMKLDFAAIDVISQALPPQIPKLQPAAPLGLYDLYVLENPRELNLPPPRDIFGGDTPMGIGEAGMSEVPQWGGRDVDGARGVRVGDEYLWPEEREEESKEEAAWWEGAGKKELSLARKKDYQGVEDVLLTGKRIRRPPDVTLDDIEGDLAVIAMKTQLLERSALVAELHPDRTRQIELQIQEEGSRTVFVRGLPFGLDPVTVKDAFSRCGPVHQVMIREPTFRDGEDGGPSPSSPNRPKPKRAFTPKPHSAFATSSPHGLVVFKDEEGFRRATTDSFRIFGVNIEGVAVTTTPAHQCRTLYVENLEMRTGLQMVEAINDVLRPQYTVGLKTHFLDDETPQVVAIPLRNYAALRAVDTLLSDAGFLTTFHYTVPKARGSKSDDAAAAADAGEDEWADDDPEEIHIDESELLSFDDEEGEPEMGSGLRGDALEDMLAPHHR